MTRLVGELATIQGGVQWKTTEVKTEFVDPFNTGKPIYRKAVSLGALLNAAAKSVPHGVTGLNVAAGAYLKVWGSTCNGTTHKDRSQSSRS